MDCTDRGEVTARLIELTNGESGALDRLIRQVYPELRRMARRMMAGERVDHTLSATALVHEGFLRLFGKDSTHWKDSHHFFLTAAKVMEHVLTDHARKKAANKRDSDQPFELPSDYPADELVAIGELLDGLEAVDARATQVLRLRFYLGMTDRETAAILDISEAIVQQDWKWARAWLRAALHGPTGTAPEASDHPKQTNRR